MADHTAHILRGIADSEENETLAKRLYAAANKYESLLSDVQRLTKQRDHYMARQTIGLDVEEDAAYPHWDTMTPAEKDEAIRKAST